MIIGVEWILWKLPGCRNRCSGTPVGIFSNMSLLLVEQAAAPENERQKYAYYAGRWA